MHSDTHLRRKVLYRHPAIRIIDCEFASPFLGFDWQGLDSGIPLLWFASAMYFHRRAALANRFPAVLESGAIGLGCPAERQDPLVFFAGRQSTAANPRDLRARLRRALASSARGQKNQKACCIAIKAG